MFGGRGGDLLPGQSDYQKLLFRLPADHLYLRTQRMLISGEFNARLKRVCGRGSTVQEEVLV